MNRIETIEVVQAYNDPANPWLRVFYDRVRFSDGRQGRYVRVVANEGRPGVVILPLRSDGHVGLVRVYRYPISEFLWEAPRGFGEGPSPEQDALRELEEETGMTAEPLISLGSIHPDSGLMASVAHIFAAIDPVGPERTSTLDDEISDFQWFRMSDVREMIRNGVLRDGFTLAAMMLAVEKGLLGVV